MSDGKKSAATTFQGRKSRRAVYTVAPGDFTHVGNGHYIHQMVLSKDELAKHDEASMFHRCAEAHNAMTATLHTIDGSQAVIGVTHSVQKPDGGNPIPREPHPHAESVTYHHETPDMRQVLAFHHVGVANDGTEHTAIFENTEHKASEIATLMSQDGMEDATSVRDAVIMQPTEGPYKGKFLYRKEPPVQDGSVVPAMVAFSNNAGKYPPISHADGHQYYAVDSRTKGVIDTMTNQVKSVIEHHVGDPVMTVHAFVSDGSKAPHVVVQTNSHRVNPSEVLTAPNPVAAVGSGTGNTCDTPHNWKMVTLEPAAGGGDASGNGN